MRARKSKRRFPLLSCLITLLAEDSSLRATEFQIRAYVERIPDGLNADE